MTTYVAGSPVETRTRTVSGIFVWICGVILPGAAVLFEAMTAMCVKRRFHRAIVTGAVRMFFGQERTWLGVE